jgi:hypothetical protein
MDYLAYITSLAPGVTFEGRDLVAAFPTDCFEYASTDSHIVELRAARTAVATALDTGLIDEGQGVIYGLCDPAQTHWVNIFAGRTFVRI